MRVKCKFFNLWISRNITESSMKFGKQVMLLVILLLFSGCKRIPDKPLYPEINLDDNDRILILAPHPDDEVLGCGGIIEKAHEKKLPLSIVFFTYGDNNQWSFIVYRDRPVVFPGAVRKMGLVRHDEAIAAAKVLGVKSDDLIFLGYPDFRTLNIWYSHWGDTPPVKSMLTKVNKVPYSNAFRPGALYKGEEILKDLETIILSFKPTKIFVSHPADHNPDHQALYLFTRVALWNLKDKVTAELYPYIVHFPNWPRPKRFIADRQLLPPAILNNKIKWQTSLLDSATIRLKYEALKKHASQFEVSSKYLLSFIGSNELFGDFPVVKLEGGTGVPYSLNKSIIDSTNISTELTEEEKNLFVGIESRDIGIEGDNLVLSVETSRPLMKTAGLSIYLFGYRDDKGFEKMPKIHILFSSGGYKVLDKNHLITKYGLKVVSSRREKKIWVPLELLGNPKIVLTSARTYTAKVPLDWVSWRIIELP
jgi:N-acetyl-1-D-myo-inositol-2-amino-2-deoxy-alpha-D-glucopyranoside deacetylase